MNETTFTLTPEVTTVIKDTGGNGAELLVQGVQFAAALVLVGVLIALVIVLVKIKFTDSSSALSEGKKSIVTIATVFFSFIMFFSLILYINPNLLAFDWFRFSGESGGKVQLNIPATKEVDTTSSKPITASDLSFAQITANEADVRALFDKNSIKINAQACTSVGQTKCTTVGGMSPKTIDMLLKLKTACQCEMTISGGTEWWSHSMTTKHRPGDKTAVDLRKDLYLTNFIKEGQKNGFEPALSWSTCYSAFTWSGFYFCDEKNTAPHWHIDPL